MIRGHRVGTLTSGIVLIFFGVMFLLRIFIPTINYQVILSLWPLILIFLGIEILVSYFVNKQEVLRYDLGAIAIILLVTFFAMGMACVDFSISHWATINRIW